MVRTQEYLNTVVGNNRTVKQNILNGKKAWETRKQRMINKALDNGIDVQGLLNEYLHAKFEYDQDFTIQGVISREIIRIPRRSFERWGDPNHINRVMIANWFSEDSANLDTQVEEINSMFGTHITECDVCEFISDYNRRDDYGPIWEINQARELFKEAVGFDPERY